MMSSSGTKTTKVFISYSHKDEKLREALEAHLKVLRDQSVISTWNDRRITAGRDWAGLIDEHLNTAAVILLLISAEFIASEYCNDKELKRALERHRAGEARVVPVILRPVDLQGSPLASLQALPKDGKAVTLWRSRDRAFQNISEGVRKIVAELGCDDQFGGQRTPPETVRDGYVSSEQEKALSFAGTLVPSKHVYVRRRQDAQLLRALLDRDYVNLVAPRSMGKSSMIMQTAMELRNQMIDCALVDLPGELGEPNNADDYFIPLIGKVARDLKIDIDPRGWWLSLHGHSISQRIMRFFSEHVAESVYKYAVIFMDEIETTKRLGFSSNLFYALKAMYNERAIMRGYEKIGFCLTGTGMPANLMKTYNIGQKVELEDFDLEKDDLSAIARILHRDATKAKRLLNRLLFWTNGQPYLTVKIAASGSGCFSSEEDVDAFVRRELLRVEVFAEDPHFYDILSVLKEIEPGNLNVQHFFLASATPQAFVGSMRWTNLLY
jgi:hypothetical protein